MIKTEKDLVAVIRRLAEALESLSGEDLSKLCDPAYTLEIKATRRRSKDAPPVGHSAVSVEQILDQLASVSTRDEAQSLLDLSALSKKQLEPIARKLDIPIVKIDKAEALRDKIVEATVGARIRSQTIQGTRTS